MAREKRQAPRIPAAFPVELNLPDTSIRAKTRDISDGGAYLRLGDAVPPTLHTRVTVRVLGLPSGPGELLDCVVVRAEEDGFAVRFVSGSAAAPSD